MMNFGRARDARELAERALNRRQELYFSARRREMERQLGMEPHTLSRELWTKMVKGVKP